MNYVFYIGEGSEAQNLIEKCRKRITAQNEAGYALNKRCEELGFSGCWQKNYVPGGPTMDRALTRDEEFRLGVKSLTAKHGLWFYSPRLNTKAGKRLQDIFSQARSQMGFYPSDFIVREMGVSTTCFSSGALHHSVAGFSGERILVRVPVDEQDGTPTPPTWCREVKESEFLAAQGL